MKTKLRRLSAILFACAFAAAFIAGSRLCAIQRFSGRAVELIFPVRCSVEYSDGSAAFENVSVRFSEDTAFFSANGSAVSIPVENAVFTLYDSAARRDNTVRSGLLSALLTAAAFAVPSAFACLGAMVYTASKRCPAAKRRRAPAERRAEKRIPVCAA